MSTPSEIAMRIGQISAILFATATLAAQAPVATHPLGPVIATAPMPFARIDVGQLLTFDDGRAIVADEQMRTVWLFDANFANPRSVLDSLPGRVRTFSSGSFIMPFRGDTALVFDWAATAIVAIGPDGALGRTFAAAPARPALGAAAAAAPRPGPANIPGFSTYIALPVTSSAFGFVYRFPRPAAVQLRNAGTPRLEDSMYIVRMDLTSRRVDTLTKLASGPVANHIGAIFTTSVVGPIPTQPKRRPDLLPFADEAAVTTDGSIAMLHGHDYRLEWISPDGSHSATKLTYPWRRITDADRQHMVDSLNAAGRAKYDSLVAKRAADSMRTGLAPMSNVTYGDGRRGQMVTAPPRVPATYLVDDVPDYYPPIQAGGMQADRDNNVWIKPNVAVPDPAGVVWEIVNRKSVVIDRVRIPTNATIVGFGPGGIVYLTTHDAGKLVLAEGARARVAAGRRHPIAQRSRSGSERGRGPVGVVFRRRPP